MPPKDYDLLRPVYGSSVYGVISNVKPAYRYDPVDSLITTLNIIIGNLDQYSEDEVFEALPEIEMEINNLPIDDFVKSRLCNMLWDPSYAVGISLHAITTLLSNKDYITNFQKP